MFPLGFAALLTALLAVRLLAVSVQRVVPLHFDLRRLLVGPPWDPGQQAEVCREQKRRRRENGGREREREKCGGQVRRRRGEGMRGCNFIYYTSLDFFEVVMEN